MTEDELLREVGIRAISTECTFAETAFRNIDRKAQADNDMLFSSIHSFLSHCANVSKLLRSSYLVVNGQTIEQVLAVSEQSEIHDRWFRNSLDHYDERLAEWINEMGSSNKSLILDYNVGPLDALGVDLDTAVVVRHYDRDLYRLNLLGRAINLHTLLEESRRIRTAADTWLTVNAQLQDAWRRENL